MNRQGSPTAEEIRPGLTSVHADPMVLQIEHMTFDAAYIDQIVQNVMREMKSRMTVAAVGSAPVSAQAHAVKGQEVPKSLTIAAKVVSEDVLVAARAAGSAIALQAGAIITPSGRDYIRRNGITVTGTTINQSPIVSTGNFIVVGNNSICQTAATAAGWKSLTASSEHEAASVAFQLLKSGLTVTCGGEPSIVACLLNRNPDIRAAVITKATSLNMLTSVMSPQVVCLESSGWSFGDILKLLRSLSSANRPQGWKEI